LFSATPITPIAAEAAKIASQITNSVRNIVSIASSSITETEALLDARAINSTIAPEGVQMSVPHSKDHQQNIFTKVLKLVIKLFL
jgi:hypothetical protein